MGGKIKVLKVKFLRRRGFTLIELPVVRKRVTNPETQRVPFGSSPRAFTLIELLIVIAIIGILATVIIVSYMNAQVKSRDNKRRADVQAIASAHQLMHQDTNKWYIPGTGYKDAASMGNGSGWFNANSSCHSSYDQKSIATGLEEAKYIDVAPKDPKMTDDCTVPYGYFQYMVYRCDEGGVRVFARLEYPTSQEISETQTEYNIACQADFGYEMNYTVLVK